MPSLRLRKLVKPTLQLKVILTFLGCGLTAVFVQAILTSRALAQLAGRVPVEESRLLGEVPHIVLSNFAITLLLLLPLFVLVGALVTFRTAGPIYRLEKYLDGLLRGSETGRCRLRQGDELQELCERINTLADRLRAAEATQAGACGPGAAEHEAARRAAS